MQEPLEGISFNSLYYFFSLLYFFFLCGDDVSARCILCPASINEMPAPDDAVFVFIKISYEIFYNRFRVIRV